MWSLYVRPYVHNQTRYSHKLISDPGRSRQELSNDVSFEVIRGQGQGHWASEVSKITIFKVYLLRHLVRYLEYFWWFSFYRTISKFDRASFLNFAFVFVSRDLELWKNENRPKCPHSIRNTMKRVENTKYRDRFFHPFIKWPLDSAEFSQKMWISFLTQNALIRSEIP